MRNNSKIFKKKLRIYSKIFEKLRNSRKFFDFFLKIFILWVIFYCIFSRLALAEMAGFHENAKKIRCVRSNRPQPVRAAALRQRWDFQARVRARTFLLLQRRRLFLPDAR